MKRLILWAFVAILCAGCGNEVNVSTATYAPLDSRQCAQAQRQQYSDAQWAAMSPLERGIAGAMAAGECTP